MNVIDGSALRTPHEATWDVVVVGTGPAGAAVARTLSLAGARVALVEEGPVVRPEDFPADGFTAMASLYRSMGTTVLLGRAPIPFLQGRVVGGTSVINGAISWRLPDDVREGWIRDDPALGERFGGESLGALFDAIERELHIAPTDPRVAGPKNLLLARGAEALGLAHRPIHRNVRGCRGLGRCLQGCPEGNKLSMDRSYLPEACAHGAVIHCNTGARRVLLERGRAVGVEARAAHGVVVRLRARRAVVLAASAVQSPLLLLASGLRQGPVGRHFQCHPGVSVAGRFRDPVRLWTGATQGHEVTGLRREGLKFEALGYDLAIAGTRVPGAGSALAAGLGDLDHQAHWGAAVRARAEGRVRSVLGRTLVSYALGREDMALVRRGVRVLGELFLAAGAEYVSPGVHGWHGRVSDRAVMARFEREGPLDPRAYAMAATHLFGTCRMGSDPARSVVRPDFRHHAVEGLYVADSSVFPSSTGVNPQTSILALATLCARSIRDDGAVADSG